MPSKFTGGLPRWVYRAMAPRELPLGDFRGGLNLISYPETSDAQLVDAINIEIDRIGRGVVPSYSTQTTPGLMPGNRTCIGACYSRSQAGVILQMSDGTFWRWANGNGTTIAAGAVLLGAAPAETKPAWFVEFNGEMIVACPSFGIYYVNGGAGAVWTQATAAIKPFMLAVWQGKVWAIGDQAFPTRLWASNAGNSHVWTNATDWVEIRDPDDAPLTSILSTQQLDFQGKGSLLVYKRRSIHRVNSADATVGFTFTTLGVGAGCTGRESVVAYNSLAYSNDETGVWVTDGLSRPERLSINVSPLWDSMASVLAGSTWPAAAAGWKDQWQFPVLAFDDRILFAMPSPLVNGTNVCTAFLVYDVRLKTFTGFYGGGLAGFNNFQGCPLIRVPVEAGFANMGGAIASSVLLIGKNGVPQSQGYALYHPQAEISGWRFQTSHLAPAAGARFNARRLRVRARNGGAAAITVASLLDYSEAAASSRTIPGLVSDTSIKPTDLWSFGKPRALAFRFSGVAGGTLLADPDPGTVAGRTIPTTLIESATLEWSLAGRI